MTAPPLIALAIPHAPWIPERAENMAAIRAALRGRDGLEVQEFTERAPWAERAIQKWRWALSTGADRFVHLEDDVLLAPCFVRALHAMHVAWSNDAICLATTHPMAPIVREQGRRSYRSTIVRGWAFSLPMPVVKSMLTYADEGALKEYASQPDSCEDTFVAQYLVPRQMYPRHPVPTIVDHRNFGSTNAGFNHHTGTQASMTWRSFEEADMVEAEWWDTPTTWLAPNYTELVVQMNGLCVYCGKHPGVLQSDVTKASLCRNCIGLVGLNAMGIAAKAILT